VSEPATGEELVLRRVTVELKPTDARRGYGDPHFCRTFRPKPPRPEKITELYRNRLDD